ncbi:KxYKxGKxW signal peptide domain-containing protein [Staphylococcus auricularis]|uniref:KxYKxGKxW signal peptide domain-containing protein n=1 Tax=Staphylococcus auricularis TaxID=29379 RepID=UPI0024320786|nr:KxYKxGKxW signal peptide domain-containing protein [Staphylococcus auricularis]
MAKQQRNKFRQSFADEKARVRLYKSGKNWVKAGIKEIKLLGIMGVPFLSSSIEKQPDLSQKTDGFVKRQALKTTAVSGGIFTVNMLHDQQAFAASDAPVTSELSAYSETVGNQNSTAIGKSETNTSASEELSTSISESESASLAEQATSESTSEEEADKASTSSRADEEQSESTEASSTSERQEESESAKKETTSEEAEQPASESSNSASTSAEQTSEKQQSSESVKEDKAEQKSTKADETSESQASQSTATSEDKASEKASTSQNAKDTSASQKAERQSTSTTESTTGKDVVSDVISFKTSTSESRGYSGFRARSAGRIALDNFARLAENSARAAADVSQTQTYTGSGYDNKGLKVYYKLRTKQNGNHVDFSYTVTYDNPNTSQVERPNIAGGRPDRGAGIYNTPGNTPFFYLGPGFGKPTNGTTAVTTPNGSNVIGPVNEIILTKEGGYYWAKNLQMAVTQSELGYGLTTKWSAPYYR